MRESTQQGSLRWVLVAVSLLATTAATSADTIHLLPTPCRVLDTRVVSSSPPPPFLLPIYVRATYDPASFQGGTAGCSVPDTATGVIANLAVVAPSHKGHASLYPGDAVAPTPSSVINFEAHDNESNLVTMRLAVLDEDSLADLILAPRFASAHWVLDLQGYTAP